MGGAVVESNLADEIGHRDLNVEFYEESERVKDGVAVGREY